MINLQELKPILDLEYLPLSSYSNTGDDIPLYWPNIPDCFKRDVESEYEAFNNIKEFD